MIEFTLTKCFLGNAMRVSNGKIQFTVTLDVGPRIISLSKLGGENIMFEDVDDAVNRDVSSVYGEGRMWHIYGGHRLWLSPEDESTYYPDNTPVRYEKLENGIRLTPEAWSVVEVQPEMLIEFVSQTELRITHAVKNLGQGKNLCLWALSVFKSGGEMHFALETKDTGLLANRNIVLWPYTDITDGKIKITNEEIIMRSSTQASKPMKIGAHNANCEASYALDGTTVVKRWRGEEGKSYPDFSCNFETYASNLIHEVESLSAIEYVASGDTITHTEYWEVY